MSIIPFRPFKPNPRNGFVYACKSYQTKYVDGVESEMFAGFIVVHMADDGYSAAIFRGYQTLANAQAAAKRIGCELNAEVAQ